MICWIKACQKQTRLQLSWYQLVQNGPRYKAESLAVCLAGQSSLVDHDTWRSLCLFGAPAADQHIAQHIAEQNDLPEGLLCDDT